MAITVSILDRFAKFFRCCKKQINFQQNLYMFTHHTLSMLPHYLGKLNHLHGHNPGDIIDTAIDQWRKGLHAHVCANDGHFEHLL